jgi:hypothetical protein
VVRTVVSVSAVAGTLMGKLSFDGAMCRTEAGFCCARAT